MKSAFGFLCLIFVLSFPMGYAVEKLRLSSGYDIPVVGLGTSTIKLSDMDASITSALENGYRHIDTAFAYQNEEAIGKALKKWFDKGGKREDLFITSKLPSYGNRPESVEKYLSRSLKDLGLNYVDMYLMHTPFGVKENNFSALEENGNEVFEPVDHIAVWKEMEKQVKSGRAKSIGLSNFNQSQIMNIYKHSQIKPSNLQVEAHTYLQQKDVRIFCKNHDIVMTAYAPLGSQSTRKRLHKGTEKDLPPLFELPIIKILSEKYNKTPSQILLRHMVQHGLVVIPKSSNAERQKANIDLFDFEFNEEDMKLLDALDKGEKGRVFDFLGFYKDLDKNSQYPFTGRP